MIATGVTKASALKWKYQPKSRGRKNSAAITPNAMMPPRPQRMSRGELRRATKSPAPSTRMPRPAMPASPKPRKKRSGKKPVRSPPQFTSEYPGISTRVEEAVFSSTPCSGISRTRKSGTIHSSWRLLRRRGMRRSRRPWRRRSKPQKTIAAMSGIGAASG